MKIYPFLALLFVAFGSVLRAAQPPELPLEVFFGDAQASQVQISPDGRYLALLAPANNRLQLVVVDRKVGKRQRITDMKDESVVGFRWVKNTRLLFHQQVKGQESFGTYAVNADGSNLRVLQQATVLEGERIANADDRRGFSIIDDLPDDPDHVLAAVVRGRSGLRDVYRININNEKRTLVLQNYHNVRSWMSDGTGTVRLGYASDSRERTFRIIYRLNEESDFREISIQDSDAPGWRPLAFDDDNKTLFITSDVGRKTFGLFKYDPEANQVTETLISDPLYDVNPSLIFSETKRRYVGASYNAEKPTTVWFDEDFKRLQAALDAALPETRNFISSFTDDESTFIVHASSDRDPGSYYLYDAKERTLALLARRNPQADPAQMAEVRPITYQARDGMQLYGYLTLPARLEPKNLPLVVLPHGGPYGPRDSWGFDPEAQFLANRGFAVLQVNFRGSGGYGRDYEAAGYRQWGLAMQTDLTDGVEWTIQQGYTDRRRVVIYGASYGGYAVLAGLAFSPELYVCGINYVGVSDISRLGFMNNFTNLSKPTQEYLSRRFLHPHKDAEQIKATSPVNHVEKIRVPLLMAYGEYDPRVTIDHGEVLEAALKKHGKEYKNIVVRNEGHGFNKFENRIAFYREMDAFLKRNVPATAGDEN